MRTLCFASLVPVLLVASGCGGPTRERTVAADLEYAKDTKTSILRLQELAQRDVRAVKNEVAVLVENYATYEQAPLGEQKAIYDGLVKGLSELQEMLGRNASKQQVLDKIDELVKQANQLPGDPDPEPTGEE